MDFSEDPQNFNYVFDNLTNAEYRQLEEGSDMSRCFLTTLGFTSIAKCSRLDCLASYVALFE